MTTTRWQAVAVAAALIVLTAALYGAQITRTPVYLNNDEASFALQAHAIATTGRDTNGRWLPLYFNVYENLWYQPLIVYAMAVSISIGSLTEWAARAPSVVCAILNVLLVAAIARHLTGSLVAATAAGGMLLLTPAHFTHARLACDYIYPLPFTLFWMWCLLQWLNDRRERWLVAGATALGVGLYTYIASLVMMPLYLGLTVLTLMLRREVTLRRLCAVVLPSLLLVAPMVIWLVTHPEMYQAFAARYQERNVAAVGESAPALDVSKLLDRLDVFVHFFAPRFLFEVAESNVMSSTYTTGVFLKAMGAFVAVGLFAALRHFRADRLLTLTVFVTAPVAACLVIERYAIDRALMLLPAGVLLAALGFHWLVSVGGIAGRAVALGLLLWMPWQFDGFHRDYLTDYRHRSAVWFNGNNRGAMRDLLDSNPPGGTLPIYLADNIPFVQVHWHLYTRMFNRTDALTRTVFFNPSTTPLEEVPPGASVLTMYGDRIERELLKRADVRPVQFTMEPDGLRTFVRFQKTF